MFEFFEGTGLSFLGVFGWLGEGGVSAVDVEVHRPVIIKC